MLAYLVIAATALACFLLARAWHSIFAWGLGLLNLFFYLFFPFGKYLALLTGLFVIASLMRSPPANR